MTPYDAGHIPLVVLLLTFAIIVAAAGIIMWTMG